MHLKNSKTKNSSASTSRYGTNLVVDAIPKNSLALYSNRRSSKKKLFLTTRRLVRGHSINSVSHSHLHTITSNSYHIIYHVPPRLHPRTTLTPSTPLDPQRPPLNPLNPPRPLSIPFLTPLDPSRPPLTPPPHWPLLTPLRPLLDIIK